MSPKQHQLSSDGVQKPQPTSQGWRPCDGHDTEPAGLDQSNAPTILVTWDGGDSDPANPQSFGKTKKWCILLIVCGASFGVTSTSSIYTPTYSQMEAEFKNSRLVSILGLSLFVMGMACGPLLFGPLSEIYGRRPIYLAAWLSYLVWLAPQAVARNIATVLVARFFNAFSGGTFLAVSGGTVGDLFAAEEVQYPMAIMSVSPFLGPCIGPLLGGLINYHLYWRWTYYILLICAVVVLVAIVCWVPETYHPVILKTKARSLRHTLKDGRYRAPIETTRTPAAVLISRSLSTPFQLLFFEPMCLSLCIYSAVLLGILYVFFGAFPIIFGTIHGFNLWQVGLAFLGIGVGLILGVATDPVWHHARVFLAKASDESAKGLDAMSEPEYRLVPSIAGAAIVPIGLFMFAWTSYRDIHWLVPIVGSMIFGIGNILVFTGIFTFLVAAYPRFAASALAANTFVRCIFAGVFPLVGQWLYRAVGFQWASSVLAFLTVAMMPFPYIFFKYGKAIRARSRFAKM